MFVDAMGLILADHTRANLADLEAPRSLAAVPFAGRYRIIDFTLSSMVNSGIKNVGVVANHKYRSLMDHLGTGSYWDLDRMQQGLSILPPFLTSDFQDGGTGSLVGLYDFVDHATQNYVVICESDLIMNIDFAPYVAQAKESGAKLTILYNRDRDKAGEPYFLMELDADSVVRDLYLNPREMPTDVTALGIMIVERDFLMQYLELEVARGRNRLSVENLLRLFPEEEIKAAEYKDLILRIHSLPSYFRASQEILNMEVFDSIFNQENRPVYTKVKNEAPAIYLPGNKVKNTLLSDGCAVAGEVEDSILFRGVQVGRRAEIEACIIGQDCVISEGAELRYVILDKDTVIRPGVKLIGQPDYPVVIGKGLIV